MVLRPSGTHFHRVFPAVHTMVTLGRFVLLNSKQEPSETTVFGEDLRQSKREDAVASLQPLLKGGPYCSDCGVLKLQLSFAQQWDNTD